jgi:hypothetical protein
MNRLAQEAVLIGLTRRLWERGSWSGETHLQKATFLARRLLDIPFDFDFILYKHGPFSFKLRDELGSMRADRLLDREAQPAPYGPRIRVTERGAELEQRFERTMSRFGPRLDWLADWIGDRGVVELERLATALWVTDQMGLAAPLPARAEALNELKPHVSLAAAEEAVSEVDAIIPAAQAALPA